MDPIRRAVGGCLLAIGLLTTHGSIYAASPRDTRELTAQEAAAMVQQQTGGQALSVQQETRDNRKVYRVRVVTRDGRVREVTVDAQSKNDKQR